MVQIAPLSDYIAFHWLLSSRLYPDTFSARPLLTCMQISRKKCCCAGTVHGLTVVYSTSPDDDDGLSSPRSRTILAHTPLELNLSSLLTHCRLHSSCRYQEHNHAIPALTPYNGGPSCDVSYASSSSVLANDFYVRIPDTTMCRWSFHFRLYEQDPEDRLRSTSAQRFHIALLIPSVRTSQPCLGKPGASPALPSQPSAIIATA